MARTLEEIREDVQRADDFKRPYDERAIRYYRLYKNYKDAEEAKKRARRGRSNVQIAKAAEFVETVVPRFVEALLANAPEYVVLQPRTAEDEEFVDNATVLMNYFMERARIPDRFVTGFKEGAIVGTFVAMPTWERIDLKRTKWGTFREYLETNEVLPPERYWTKELKEMLEAAGGDPSLLSVEVLDLHRAPMTVVDTKEGPELLHIPFLDFFVDPRAKDYTLKGAKFAGRRFRATVDELEEVNKALKAAGLPPRYKHLDKLDKRGGAAGWVEGVARYRESVEGVSSNPHQDKTHEILEIWYTDGMVHAVANDEVLIREEESPFFHRNLPFVLFTPIPDVTGPFGISMFEWTEDELEDLNEVARSARDFMNLLLNPPMFGFEEAVVDPFDLQNIRPGKFIKLDSMFGDRPARDVLFPMPMNNSWPTAQADMQAISARLNGVTGLTDPVRGAPLTRRTTVGEQQILVEEANARLKLAIRTLNEGFKLVANHFLWLAQQYMPERMAVRVQGQSGERSFTEVPRDNIDRNYDIYPASSSLEALANRGAQQQQLVNFMNTISSTPAAEVIDWTELARVALSLSGVRHASRILPLPQQRVAQVMQALQDPQIGPQIMQAIQQMQQQQMAAQAPPVEGSQVNSGAATPAQQAGRNDEQQAAMENEQLLMGQQVPVDPGENHAVHLEYHKVAWETGQAEGMDLTALEQHAQEHAAYLEGANGQAASGGVPA